MSTYDPYPVMMIQIQWWSRSSDDDPDPVMIQFQWWWSRWSDDQDPVMMSQIEWWWSRANDDPYPNEYELNVNMTWRWRWRELNDDPDDTKKMTCADTFCRENTFPVKRECWCNCNFRMYSLVFLIYCNSMFILGCIVMYLIHVIPRCLFRDVFVMYLSHVMPRCSYWEVL